MNRWNDTTVRRYVGEPDFGAAAVAAFLITLLVALAIL